MSTKTLVALLVMVVALAAGHVVKHHDEEKHAPHGHHITYKKPTLAKHNAQEEPCIMCSPFFGGCSCEDVVKARHELEMLQRERSKNHREANASAFKKSAPPWTKTVPIRMCSGHKDS